MALVSSELCKLATFLLQIEKSLEGDGYFCNRFRRCLNFLWGVFRIWGNILVLRCMNNEILVILVEVQTSCVANSGKDLHWREFALEGPLLQGLQGPSAPLPHSLLFSKFFHPHQHHHLYHFSFSVLAPQGALYVMMCQVFRFSLSPHCKNDRSKLISNMMNTRQRNLDHLTTCT